MTDLANLLRASDNIALLTHRRPDGDTVGSAAAICRALRAIGKNAYIMPDPAFTARLSVMTDGLLAPTDFQPNFILAVDFGTASRATVAYENQVLNAVIDHHPTSSDVPAGSVVEPESAATGELAFLLIEELGVALDEAMASAIYTAISTDTGCFLFSNTTARTHRIAAAVTEAGAKVKEINNAHFAVKTRGRIAVETLVRSHTEFYFSGRLAICFVSREEEQTASTNEDDFDNISNLTKDIEGVVVGAMLRELENGCIRVSLRTSSPIDAAEICSAFGGGGHSRAAGFTSGKKAEWVTEDIKSAVESRLPCRD